MAFDLIGHGLDTGSIQYTLGLRTIEVWDTDALGEAGIDRLLQLAPRVQEIDRRKFDFAVGTGREQITVFLVGERPVNQIQVQVRCIQIGQRRFQCWQHKIRAMESVPQFAGQK